MICLNSLLQLCNFTNRSASCNSIKYMDGVATGTSTPKRRFTYPHQPPIPRLRDMCS